MPNVSSSLSYYYYWETHFKYFVTFDREFSTADKSFVLGQLLEGDRPLYKGIRGCAAGIGNRYVFTSAGIY